MTAVLTRLLGRLPIGWLQLVHNKGRLAAAVAGVAFANLLVFMQLGFLGALVHSIGLPYGQINAAIMLSASDANTLTDGSPLPRQRMFQALAVPGIATATPLAYGKVDWRQADGSLRTLDVFGIDPVARAFRAPSINDALTELTMSDTALVDRRTRNVPPGVFERIAAGDTVTFEAKGRTLRLIGTFEIGGGFSADGYLIVSDQTFLKLFPQRASGAPNHILLTLEPGADRDAVIAALRAHLPADDTQVRTVAEAIRIDQTFQTTQRPVGLIFGFGVAMGVMVGVVIVYQVLSTDVADHLKEYATFKAIGYRQGFFTGIVFEQAMILAILGFVPGVIAAAGLYAFLSAMTGLPVEMPPARPVLVFIGTVAMCALSGAIATRRLAKADPAELF